MQCTQEQNKHVGQEEVCVCALEQVLGGERAGAGEQGGLRGGGLGHGTDLLSFLGGRAADATPVKCEKLGVQDACILKAQTGPQGCML